MSGRTTAVAGSLAVGLIALTLAGLSTVAQAADPIPGAGTTVGTVVDPANPFAVPAAPTGRTANVAPPIAKIGDSVIVTGSGWPAGSLISVAVWTFRSPSRVHPLQFHRRRLTVVRSMCRHALPAVAHLPLTSVEQQSVNLSSL